MSTRSSSTRPVAQNPEGVLTTSDLRALGWPRRAVDAILRGTPTVHLPGYSRPVVRVCDYLAFVEAHTFDGERVR